MEKRDPCATLVGLSTGAVTMEHIVCRFGKKIKVEQPYDPAISLLGTYLKQTKTPIQKDICTLTFTAALFIIAKIWKQPKCSSTDEWIKKIWYKYILFVYIYAYNGLLLLFLK